MQSNNPYQNNQNQYPQPHQNPIRFAPYPNFEVNYAPVQNHQDPIYLNGDNFNNAQRLSQQQQQPQYPALNQNQLFQPLEQNLSQFQNYAPPLIKNQSQEYAKPQNLPQNNPIPNNQSQPRHQSKKSISSSQNGVLSGIFGPSVCAAHHKPLKNICKDEGCQQRLLCDFCVFEPVSKGQEKPHKDIAAIQELLDISLFYQLEAYAKEEENVFQPLDDRYHGVCSTISSSFEDLRIKISELLVQSEERAKVKAQEYFLQPRPKKWVALMEEYKTKKAAYVSVQNQGQTRQLDDFVSLINKVEQQKKEKEEDSIHHILEIQKEQMEKILRGVKASITMMVDKLFPSSNIQEPDLKVSVSDLKFFKDVKTNNKFIMNSMVYIPKLGQIVTGSETGTISTWNPVTLDPIKTYKVHDGPINSLLYLEKENLLLTGSRDTLIKMFPVTNTDINVAKSTVFSGHTEAVRSLLYLEGEDKFASAGEDPNIRIWNISTGNLDATISTKEWRSFGDEMAFIRPEKWIVVAGKKDIKIFDYVTGDLLMTQSGKALGSMDYLLEKRLLMLQEDNDKVILWRINSEKKKLKKETKFSLQFNLKKPAYFQCLESSDLVLVSIGTNKIAVFSLSTGTLLKQIETNLQSTTCLTWLKGERRLLVGDSASGNIGILQY